MASSAPSTAEVKAEAEYHANLARAAPKCLCSCLKCCDWLAPVVPKHHPLRGDGKRTRQCRFCKQTLNKDARRISGHHCRALGGGRAAEGWCTDEAQLKAGRLIYRALKGAPPSADITAYARRTIGVVRSSGAAAAATPPPPKRVKRVSSKLKEKAQRMRTDACNMIFANMLALATFESEESITLWCTALDMTRAEYDELPNNCKCPSGDFVSARVRVRGSAEQARRRRVRHRSLRRH